MLNLNVLEDLQKIIGSGKPSSEDGQHYCPKCGDYRRMRVRGSSVQIPSTFLPQVFQYTCVQCKTEFTALIYTGPDGPGLAVFPSCRGGLTTPNTPDGVGYYLDQASKAQSAGANSAAIAMFRGALDHLLFEQGYTKGMLGIKIGDLKKAIEDGSAPKWAMELETEFLDVVTKLGNGAIHPNDGDVTKQSSLDNDLVEAVKETFHELLFLIYELPHQKQQRLNALKSKANILKK